MKRFFIRRSLAGVLPQRQRTRRQGPPPAEPKDPVLEKASAATSRQDWAGAAGVLKRACREPAATPTTTTCTRTRSARAPNPDMNLVFKHYNEALRLDPKHRGAHEYIGEAYLMVGNVAKAKEHLGAARQALLLQLLGVHRPQEGDRGVREDRQALAGALGARRSSRCVSLQAAAQELSVQARPAGQPVHAGRAARPHRTASCPSGSAVASASRSSSRTSPAPPATSAPPKSRAPRPTATPRCSRCSASSPAIRISTTGCRSIRSRTSRRSRRSRRRTRC